MIRFEIDSRYKNKRVDIVVSEYIKESRDVLILNRSQIVKYLNRFIKVNDEYVKKSYKVSLGDEVVIDIEGVYKDIKENECDNIKSQLKELDIVYECYDYLIINKPSGVVIHPGNGNRSNTLANYIKGYLEHNGEYDQTMNRAGIVHRLDKGVSGLIVVAKNKMFQDHIRKEFEEHRVIKIYHALIEQSHGVNNVLNSKVKILDRYTEIEEIRRDWDTIEGYISRSSVNRKRMVFSLDKRGKRAISYIYKFNNNELLIYIKTGRMHQIRATLKYLGYNIEGDMLYKRSSVNSECIKLQSSFLSFRDIEKKIVKYQL